MKDWKDLFISKVIKGELNGQKVAEQWININTAIAITESLLKQQREIIAEKMLDNDMCDINSFMYRAILNAPEPEGEIK